MIDIALLLIGCFILECVFLAIFCGPVITKAGKTVKLDIQIDFDNEIGKELK